MPEYLAPGVYVEETSFRSKSIEGVSTSTTAFVGPTRKGPVFDPEVVNSLPPELITSFLDFERIYGGVGELTFGEAKWVNLVALAVDAYFNEGGSRLYISRVFTKGTGTGVASTEAVDGVSWAARTPGSGGNGEISFILSAEAARNRTAATAPLGSLLSIPSAEEGTPATLYVKENDGWKPSEGEAFADDIPAGSQILTFTVEAKDADGNRTTFEGLGFGAAHPRYVGKVLAQNPTSRREALENAFAVTLTDAVTPFTLYDTLFAQDAVNPVKLTNGDDGAEPDKTAYVNALNPIARTDEVSIVAAPGHSAFAAREDIRNTLVSHGDADRSYRIVVLDAPPNQTIGQAQEYRGQIDSSHAALYYPWVQTSNPLARLGDMSQPREILQPPSGFVCGIYARNDVQRGVHKAPANEVVRGALRFETDVNSAEQAVLNPRGVNCLRFFEGRGYRVWGARTASSDPEWKYVNIRRYFNYLERSIDRGTQWAVFEPNGERLWDNVRQTISDFLYNEWVSGALLGGSPKEAYFVRCDRSTMTQNNLDNGQLICLVGVAALKPAEFVIFRIGQKTADARS